MVIAGLNVVTGAFQPAGSAPYYGEKSYSGRRILEGIKAGLNNE